MRPFPAPILRLPCLKHRPLVFLSTEPFGDGIVNAQLSVLKGFEAAKRHGYIFVVPPMVQW